MTTEGRSDDTVAPLAERLLIWFDQHGRHDLPWQHPRDPYRVWLAEIMLQQTQVQTVIPYFTRFISALPDLPALAAAPIDQVMALWSGLGYYTRARNLHAAARLCVQQHGGHLPQTFDDLVALPGIGRSTAGAILAQAHGLPFPILDGNVRRVLARWRAIEGWPGSTDTQKTLWALAQTLLPDTRLADYTQALMDLGATICTRHKPDCAHCPLRADCLAYREDRIDELPTPRPAKALPQRQCLMLLAFDASNRVLLQRRIHSGVWQGLWSLPEAPDPASLQVVSALQIQTHAQGRALPAFEHVFSHYRLQITPWLVAPATALPHLGDDEIWRWVAVDELGAIGLPAPVRKLIASQSGSCTQTMPSSTLST